MTRLARDYGTLAAMLRGHTASTRALLQGGPVFEVERDNRRVPDPLRRERTAWPMTADVPPLCESWLLIRLCRYSFVTSGGGVP